jgi:SAM-dependent methyltransferase
MNGKGRTTTYQAYADVYDAFKGDRSSTAHLLNSLIEKYQPESNILLDLACGTGSIAQWLADSFTITGLDSSNRMLQIAKHKMPNVRFVRGNMENFRLNQCFDVIYCLHNSLNHLLLFQQWVSTFHTVANHLAPGGLFIFDINPAGRMEHLATLEPSVKQVGEDYVITQVFKDRTPNRYTWDVKILVKKRSGYNLKHEPVKVSCYPDSIITNALNANFKILESFERSAPETFDDIGRMYYVCAKRT